jgi:hypothetical protein
MSSRAKTSRCQGWTPSEAHPLIIEVPSNNSRKLGYLSLKIHSF